MRAPVAAVLLLAGCLGSVDDTGSGDTGPGDTGGDPVQENLATGSGDWAVDFLTDDTYTSLEVEIDHVEGYAPAPATVSGLEDALSELVFKPGGVTVVVDDAIPDQGSPAWSVAAAQDLEVAWRDRYRDEGTGTAVMYLLFLDGNAEGDDDQSKVLGYAYHGSSIVMFAETIDGLGSGPLATDPEEVVAIHEVGHLLGLVDNGVPMVDDHSDPAHPHHDESDDCIMYWAMATEDVVSQLLSGKPDFDQACRDDLAAAGGPSTTAR